MLRNTGWMKKTRHKLHIIESIIQTKNTNISGGCIVKIGHLCPALSRQGGAISLELFLARHL